MFLRVPTGFWDSLGPAARFIEWMQPKRVLDVGVGNGRMGFLVREYGAKEGIPRYKPGNLIIDGIEGYAPYLGPLQEAIYDRIIVSDALRALDDMTDRYELVIASDILEHFSEADARHFLHLLPRVGSVALVITPTFDMPQRSEINPLEDHRSFWPASTLRSAGARFVQEYPLSVLALLGDVGIIDTYAALTFQHTTIKDWVLPPELRRRLRETRQRRRSGRH